MFTEASSAPITLSSYLVAGRGVSHSGSAGPGCDGL